MPPIFIFSYLEKISKKACFVLPCKKEPSKSGKWKQHLINNNRQPHLLSSRPCTFYNYLNVFWFVPLHSSLEPSPAATAPTLSFFLISFLVKIHLYIVSTHYILRCSISVGTLAFPGQNQNNFSLNSCSGQYFLTFFFWGGLNMLKGLFLLGWADLDLFLCFMLNYIVWWLWFSFLSNRNCFDLLLLASSHERERKAT